MAHHHFRIHKSHGGFERFSKRKLYSSLKRSGLSHQQSQIITDKVSAQIREGSETKDIFHRAFQLVKRDSPEAAVHYSLKRAILELGPTGHYFESYVAKYFQQSGYSARARQSFAGRWVKHEVDVVAVKNKLRYFAECKFHNRVGIKNDIKTALYVKARWDDLREGSEGKNLAGFFLVSNTAFTSDALTYAQGTGLRLLGVNAPIEKSFLDQVKEMHLYPITSLKRLSKNMIKELLNRDVILAQELLDNGKLLLKLGLPENDIENLFKEIQSLTRITT